MAERDPAQRNDETGESGDPRLLSAIERHAQRRPLTPRRAARLIALVTVGIAILGGLLAWLLDREDFHTFGTALWWSLQTVTTVGYGDVVPANTVGRVIAGVVMLSGIGFVAVVTAAVTATLIDRSGRRTDRGAEADLARQLERIGARLTEIEAALVRRESIAPRSRPDAPGD